MIILAPATPLAIKGLRSSRGCLIRALLISTRLDLFPRFFSKG